MREQSRLDIDSSTVDETQSTIIEDILPSFQMHDYMFNRAIHDPYADEETDSELPDYASEINTIRSTRPVDPNRFINPTENPSLVLLNNVNKLPKADIPISIKIVLTKKQPMLGKSFEKESVLTQYRPGDLVTGYVTIATNGNLPIPFEMMLVSLEGEIKTPAGGLKSTDRKIVSRTFLKMYDINACYHQGHIPINAHGVKGCLQNDLLDGSTIGFDSTKSVLPGCVHKKFFSFKLPYTLLDTTCPDQITEHLHILPSFGFDEDILSKNDENMDIDPILGYKRCQAKYGSPIKVEDMALKGQSISYYVKVQMIGNEQVANKIGELKHSTKKESPFVIFADQKYFFRVEVSDDKDEINHYNEFSNSIVSNVRTYEQLVNFENFVLKTIAELQTKHQLLQAGVLDKRKQDEIIASLEVDEEKKFKQLKSSTNFHEEIVRSDGDKFLHYGTVDINDNFLSKSGGVLVIKASMSRDSWIHSVKIPALKSKHSKRKQQNNQSTSDIKSSLNWEVAPGQRTSCEIFRNTSLSMPSSDSNSSDSSLTLKSLSSLKKHKQEHCFVEFDLTFKSSHKSSKPDLPPNITIKPSLKVVNIYSTFPIPVSLDGEFLMDEQLLQYTIPNIRHHFDIYLTRLKRLVSKVQVPRPFYNSVNSLSKLSAKEVYVPKYEFLPETIDLSKKWVYDSKEHVYRASIKLPLTTNAKHTKKSSVCLIPTFQSCLVNHFYMVHFHVSTRKSTKHSVFKFPLKVI